MINTQDYKARNRKKRNARTITIRTDAETIQALDVALMQFIDSLDYDFHGNARKLSRAQRDLRDRLMAIQEQL